MSTRHRLGRAGACSYCGRPIFPAGSPQVRADPSCQATKDHVVPQIWHTAGNGVRSAVNKIPACVGCNGVKGPYPEEPFRYFVTQARGTPLFTAAEFRKFIFALAVVGFRVAHRDAVAARPPPPPLPAPRGRYTQRDLRRGA